MKSRRLVCTCYIVTDDFGIDVFTGTKLADIQLELAQEEDKSLRSGVTAIHETSPAKFLQKGLELEDQQYIFLSFHLL